MISLLPHSPVHGGAHNNRINAEVVVNIKLHNCTLRVASTPALAVRLCAYSYSSVASQFVNLMERRKEALKLLIVC